jgi:hypothetical protein
MDKKFNKNSLCGKRRNALHFQLRNEAYNFCLDHVWNEKLAGKLCEAGRLKYLENNVLQNSVHTSQLLILR